MGEIIDKKDLEGRISKVSLQRFLDDDSSGTANSKAITSLIRSAESEVWSAVAREYDTNSILTILNLTSPTAEQLRGIGILKTLALNVAEAMAYQRHPEFERQDGADLALIAMKKIKMLADAITTLPGMRPPENIGTDLFPDDPTLEAPRTFWHRSTGVF